MTFAEFIKINRESRALSQKEFGAKLGVSWNIVHRWESGDRKRAGYKSVRALSEFLNVPIVDINKIMDNQA